jgi:hypothetical protein
MKYANATKLDRRFGKRRREPALSEVEGDLQFPFRHSESYVGRSPTAFRFSINVNREGPGRHSSTSEKKSLFLYGTDTIGWMNETNQEVGLKVGSNGEGDLRQTLISCFAQLWGRTVHEDY